MKRIFSDQNFDEINLDKLVAALSLFNESEPSGDVLLPINKKDIFDVKSALDFVLEKYEMSSTAVNNGIVLHDANAYGPQLVEELIDSVARKFAPMQVAYKDAMQDRIETK